MTSMIRFSPPCAGTPASAGALSLPGNRAGKVPALRAISGIIMLVEQCSVHELDSKLNENQAKSQPDGKEKYETGKERFRFH
jgi:hypothetical protein